MTYDKRYATPAEEGAWRSYDVDRPDPGYFQFDWLSGRHPDLYHAFALSSVALVDELTRRFDLSGLVVAEIAAGTGRCTLGLAHHSRRVVAIDAYRSVLEFAAGELSGAGVTNCLHIQGDMSSVPLRNSSVDVVVCCWGQLTHAEAFRILKPNGLLVHMLGWGDAELAPILAREFPHLIPEPPGEPRRSAPSDERLVGVIRPDIRFVDDAVDIHAFDYVAEYGSPDEAAAIFGRLFGPTSAAYLRERQQSTVWSRVAIFSARVAK